MTTQTNSMQKIKMYRYLIITSADGKIKLKNMLSDGAMELI